MSVEKRQPGVMLYFEEMRPLLSLMRDAERGKLLMAILDYAEYGTEPVLSERLSAAWPLVKQKIDRDAEAYRKRCKRGSKGASARWKPGEETADT